MVTQRYAAGEIVFNEGDPSDRVGRILSGETEVVKSHAGQAIVMGRIRPREFVGEMGVIEGRRRSATVRAISDVAIEFIDREAFLRTVSEDQATAFELLVRLCTRLRHVDEALAEADAERGAATATPDATSQGAPGARLTIYAESGRLADLLPAEGYELAVLPYFVGRALMEDDPKPPISIDFTIRDEAPHRLSRVHFAVMRRDGDFVIRDFGSRLGTVVNGELLGGDFFRSHSAPLKAGDNIVIAGGADSPYTFRLRLG